MTNKQLIELVEMLARKVAKLEKKVFKLENKGVAE